MKPHIFIILLTAVFLAACGEQTVDLTGDVQSVSNTTNMWTVNSVVRLTVTQSGSPSVIPVGETIPLLVKDEIGNGLIKGDRVSLRCYKDQSTIEENITFVCRITKLITK